ncbi:hypothetical protein BHE74_00013786 [Ensete ventricosum]|nr:hypothetical protein BHE74_00013786 [Ensete ventricosum]
MEALEKRQRPRRVCRDQRSGNIIRNMSLSTHWLERMVARVAKPQRATTNRREESVLAKRMMLGKLASAPVNRRSDGPEVGVWKMKRGRGRPLCSVNKSPSYGFELEDPLGTSSSPQISHL